MIRLQAVEMAPPGCSCSYDVKRGLGQAQQTGHYSAAARGDQLIGKEIGMFRRSQRLAVGDRSRQTDASAAR
jgi:hypothetical protein